MYDLVLQNGLVVDGGRAKPYTANVCIQDGKIAKITTDTVSGTETLDVSGLAVAPGFIDTDMTAALTETAKNAALGSIPMGRMGTPESLSGNYSICRRSK